MMILKAVEWDNSNAVLTISGIMEETLVRSSGIWAKKTKFFIYRAVTYFSFLLVPIWLQKSIHLHQAVHIPVMVFYMLFMVGQWFLFGKELDHRLKIYFRVNSSLDRVVYRLLTGMAFFVLYFNLLSLLPHKWIYNSFWATWVALGLFYSWPTRGKIIQESVSTNFGEFKFLDSFEKTLVSLILLMLVVSMPEIPTLTNYSALKLFFDPQELLSPHFWNFLTVNYYPFRSYPDLFRLAVSMHFYFVCIGLFLLAFYALLRYFVSRRLSLLGIFALISSWSFSKILGANYGDAIISTFSIFSIWSILWITKSSTYRAGLFLGIVGYLGTIINQTYAFLLPLNTLMLYFVFLKDKTPWFKKQLVKYSLIGFFLVIFVLLTHRYVDTFSPFQWNLMLTDFKIIFERKAFNILSVFGLVIIFLKMFSNKIALLSEFKIDQSKLNELLLLFVLFGLYAFILDHRLISSFSMMWPIVMLSLLPIELLFQSISRLRSRRNMIYLIYILICLLDSHFEGRVKIFLRLFES